MKFIEEYYNYDSLEKTCDNLFDPSLEIEKHKDQINELVLNLIIKYISRYLKVYHESIHESIYEIRMQISNALDERERDTIKYGEYIIEWFKKGDMNQEIFPDDFQSDVVGFEFLLNIPSTAAIVKEIIFQNIDAARRNKSWSLSADFGSGSGILLLAGLIGAKRNSIEKVLGLGFEKQNESVSKSNEALKSIEVFQPENINIEKADICNLNVHEKCNVPELMHWISETICGSTPQMKVKNNNVEILNSSVDLMASQKFLEPFPIVLEQTLKAIPHFEKRVKEKTIGMFPDLINGNYQPNHLDPLGGTIKLETNGNVSLRLGEIGKEFEEYENVGIEGSR